MIRRSPAEYYIKYLVVHPDNYTFDAVRKKLEEQQLDFLDADHLTRVRDKMNVPDPFLPFDPLHTKSQRFLLKERIRGLFQRDPLTVDALALLENARAKEFIETLSLSGAPLAVIAHGLSKHRNIRCKAATVERYLHYFWNLDLVDSTELRILLEMRHYEDPTKNGHKGESKAKTAFYVSMEDPRRVAASLPSAPLMSLMSQMRMGFLPSTVDLAKVLDATQKAATLRALEATLRGGKGDSSRAFDFMTVAKMAAEVMENVVKPDDKLRDELEAIALKNDPKVMPTVHQLSGGNHTVELGPKVDEQYEPRNQ